MVTSAPARASAKAISRPMRCAPPVTSADLPLRVWVGITGLSAKSTATGTDQPMKLYCGWG